MKILKVVLLLTAASLAAQAQAVTWYLQSVVMSDGGKAVGSFTFDATAGVFSNINIQTTPGPGTTDPTSVNAGGNYTFKTAQALGSGTPLEFQSDQFFSVNTRRIQLLSVNTLISTGGTIALTQGALEGFCSDGISCLNVAPGSRSVASGTLVGLPASRPQTWYLNATFQDGGRALGTFVYDAVTSTFSQVDIATTSGASLGSGAHYQSSVTGSTGVLFGFTPQLPFVSGSRLLSISLGTSTLTNVAGNVTIPIQPAIGPNIGSEGVCVVGSLPCGTFTQSRNMLVGSLTTVPPPNYTKILSQIVDGGGFLTQLAITNLTSSPATYALTVTQDNGTPFPFGSAGIYSAVTVPARGVSFVTSTGGQALTQGWARLTGAQNFSVTAIFTLANANAGGSQQASVLGDSQGTTSIAIPFDNTGTNVIGLALTNSGLSNVNVLAVGYDQNGTILMIDPSVTLGAGGHTAFNFGSGANQHYPQLVGQRGQLRLFAIQGGNPPYLGINALLLEALPNLAITTVGVTSE